jgi:hypothetical protein
MRLWGAVYGHTGLSSLCKKRYLFNFYFWLDLIATLSLLLDIPEAYAG